MPIVNQCLIHEVNLKEPKAWEPGTADWAPPSLRHVLALPSVMYEVLPRTTHSLTTVLAGNLHQ